MAEPGSVEARCARRRGVPTRRWSNPASVVLQQVDAGATFADQPIGLRRHIARSAAGAETQWATCPSRYALPTTAAHSPQPDATIGFKDSVPVAGNRPPSSSLGQLPAGNRAARPRRRQASLGRPAAFFDLGPSTPSSVEGVDHGPQNLIRALGLAVGELHVANRSEHSCKLAAVGDGSTGTPAENAAIQACMREPQKKSIRRDIALRLRRIGETRGNDSAGKFRLRASARLR